MPLTPQITVTGNLEDILGNLNGTAVQFTLCNYGGNPPRVSGTAIVAGVQYTAQCTSGAFSVTLWGNDVIVPAGTFYTVTFLSSTGASLGTYAYQFTGTGSVDISQLSPLVAYPVIAPPAPSNSVLLNPMAQQTIAGYPLAAPQFIGTLIGGIGLNAQAAAASMTFNATQGTLFQTTLGLSVTSSTLSGAVAGQIVIFEITQNGAGGWTFAWPANVLNAQPITGLAALPGAKTVQAFVFDGTNAYPLGPATIN